MAPFKVSLFLIAPAILFGFTEAFIDSDLVQSLKSGGKSDVLINFAGDSSGVINSIKQRSFRSRSSLISALTSGLHELADSSQAPVQEYLKTQNVKSQSFFAGNQMAVRSAPLTLLQSIDKFPQVASIQKLPTVQVAPISSNAAPQAANVTWGVAKIQADKVWEQFGTRGEGVVVANIDTGVRGTHEALAGNWREDHGWFDPYTFTPTPTDKNGHGSHTLGTIAGANGIGVAPGATWIACRGCSDRSCDAAQLLACGDWILTPTNPDGTDPRPDLAPDVVCNSWGSSVGGSSWYNKTIEAWKAAGILHAFAIGNSGPRCRSGGSPGDQPETFSVGSTDVNDKLSSFSSKGPAGPLFFGYGKPDISAPGSDVYSAWFDADDSYNTISGTSMATPHVVGAIALMLSAKRQQQGDELVKLNMDDVQEIIEKTADTKGLALSTLNFRCDGLFTPVRYPNNQFGHGRLNALAAVNETLNADLEFL